MPDEKFEISGESTFPLTPAQRLAVLNDGAAATNDAEPAPALEARIAQLERQLAEARAAIDAVERRHLIDLALIDSGAHDLETARLLTEIAVGAMETPDIDAAVAELRRGKPFLFRGASPAASPAALALDAGAMGGIPIESASGAGLAAEEAARTGTRAALLRYLRARRLAG